MDVEDRVIDEPSQGPDVQYSIDRTRLDTFIRASKEINFRPVGMFVVTRVGNGREIEYLIARSTRADTEGKQVWSFPQGKIEEDEDNGDPLENIKRELKEEHYIDEVDIGEVQIGIVDTKSIEYDEGRKAEERRKGRDDNGKGYITSHIRLKPEVNVSFNEEEGVAEVRWLPAKEAKNFLASSSGVELEKKDLMFSAIDVVENQH